MGKNVWAANRNYSCLSLCSLNQNLGRDLWAPSKMLGLSSMILDPIICLYMIALTTILKSILGRVWLEEK